MSRLPHSLWNTAFIAVPSTVLVLLFAAMAAYVFAWIEFPGRDALFLVVVALTVVPVRVAVIPVARLYGDLAIAGSLLAVIVFHVGFDLPFAIFLLRNFFAAIPLELLEAARVDSAGEARIFVPLALAAWASLAIFQFLWTWNDLLVGLVFAGAENRPITVAIREQTQRFGANLGRDRTRCVRVDAGPLGRVLRIPAVPHAGTIRRVRTISRPPPLAGDDWVLDLDGR